MQSNGSFLIFTSGTSTGGGFFADKVVVDFFVDGVPVSSGVVCGLIVSGVGAEKIGTRITSRPTCRNTGLPERYSFRAAGARRAVSIP